MTRERSPGILLVAHGSLESGESSRKTRALVHELRQATSREVRCGFWREQPTLREALDCFESAQVVCVPIFISDGWFSRTVIPRELGLTGPLTGVGARTVAYTDPVGTHVAMTDVVESCSQQALRAAGLERADVTLVVAGHGTRRSQTSARAIRSQVERLSNAGFGEVVAGFMDDEPTLPRVVSAAARADVVVVPFFISDGHHVREDIPRQIGISALTPAVSSGILADKRVLYTGPVGLNETLEKVVAARVEEGEQLLDEGLATTVESVRAARHALCSMIEEGPLRIGPVSIRKADDESWRVECGATSEERVALASLDPLLAEGHGSDGIAYRPLRWARDLPRGWSVAANTAEQLIDVLEVVFPGMTARHQTVSWADSVARFSGRLSALKDVSEVGAEVSSVCHSRCLRTPVWHSSRADGAGHADWWCHCPEPCPVLLERVLESETNDGS